MKFIPSHYGDGEAAPETTESSTSTTDYVKAARVLFGLEDSVRTQLAKKRAALTSWKQQLPGKTGLARLAVEAQIRSLEEQVATLEAQAREEGLASTGLTAAQMALGVIGVFGAFGAAFYARKLYYESEQARLGVK